MGLVAMVKTQVGSLTSGLHSTGLQNTNIKSIQTNLYNQLIKIKLIHEAVSIWRQI